VFENSDFGVFHLICSFVSPIFCPCNGLFCSLNLFVYCFHLGSSVPVVCLLL